MSRKLLYHNSLRNRTKMPVSLRIPDSVLESTRPYRKSSDGFRAIRASQGSGPSRRRGRWLVATEGAQAVGLALLPSGLGRGLYPGRRDGQSPSRRPGGPAAKRWQRRPHRPPVTARTQPRTRRPLPAVIGDRRENTARSPGFSSSCNVIVQRNLVRRTSNHS